MELEWQQPYRSHAARQLDFQQPQPPCVGLELYGISQTNQFGYHPYQPPPNQPPDPLDWKQPYQPVYQPPHHPIRASDQQPSYPQDGQLYPQHHPYQARQPTCWDPPWLRQTTAYQQPSSYEPNMYSPPPLSCWDPPRVRTQPENHQPEYQLPRTDYYPAPGPAQPYRTPVGAPTGAALEQYTIPPFGQPPTCWDPPQAWQPPVWEPPDPEPSQTKDTEHDLSMLALEDVQSLVPTEAILDRLLATLAIFETRLDAMDRRLADDIEESVQSCEVHYDDTAIDQLLNRNQTGEEDVLFGVDDEHCDELSRLDENIDIHEKKESLVMASKEIIVKWVDSGNGRNESDNKWNLEESLDVLVEVSGVTDGEESESKDDWQVINVEKTKSTNLGGRSSVPVIISGSSIASAFSQKDENGVPSTWDPGALVDSSCSLPIAENKMDGETAHQYCVESISKVYQALTDPISREDYEIYCHFYGRQGFQMGIALPEFLLNIDGVSSRILREQARFWEQHPALVETELLFQAHLTREAASLTPDLQRDYKQDLHDMSAQERAELLSVVAGLSPSPVVDVESVMELIPSLALDATCETEGEDGIQAGYVVTIKAWVTLKHTNCLIGTLHHAPHYSFHREANFWLLLAYANSNSVWFSHKISFMGEATAVSSTSISSLVYTFLKLMCMTVTIFPTNVAILGVVKMLMSCLSEKFKQEAYGLGVVVLLGNGQRMKIDEHQELHDVFLDSRISELERLLESWFPP